MWELDKNPGKKKAPNFIVIFLILFFFKKTLFEQLGLVASVFSFEFSKFLISLPLVSILKWYDNFNFKLFVFKFFIFHFSNTKPSNIL